MSMYPYQHHTLYSVLGLPHRTSDATEIGRAFMKQSRMYHPDYNTHPGCPAWYQLIQYAYRVLIDSEFRSVYDRFLTSPNNTIAEPHDDHEHGTAEGRSRNHSSFEWTKFDHGQEMPNFVSSNEGASGRAGQEDNTNSTGDKTLDRIRSLERDIHELKAANFRIWNQASCHLANAVGLKRETEKLDKLLGTNQEVYLRREKGYVNRIRSLESTIFSLRRSLASEQRSEKVAKKAAAIMPTTKEQKAGGLLLTCIAKADRAGLKIGMENVLIGKTPKTSNRSQAKRDATPSVIADGSNSAIVEVLQGGRRSGKKRPYHYLPSLVDKENPVSSKIRERSPGMGRTKRRKELRTVPTNCM